MKKKSKEVLRKLMGDDSFLWSEGPIAAELLMPAFARVRGVWPSQITFTQVDTLAALNEKLAALDLREMVVQTVANPSVDDSEWWSGSLEICDDPALWVARYKARKVIVIYWDRQDAKADRFINAAKALVPFVEAPADAEKIHFLCHTQSRGFSLHPVNLAPLNIDLALNYGDAFPAIHGRLMDFLQSGKIGLALLHGPPGTGKTSYIRHLMRSCKKKLIYVPPHLTDQIADPTLLPFMLEEAKDSIFILEDSERIVEARRGDSSAVSNLLNLSDGIIGESIKCKLVCTFNVPRTKIDEALLRKGRLALEYKFGPLGVADSARLLKRLGKECTPLAPMTLADIYNLEADSARSLNKERPIGFRAA